MINIYIGNAITPDYVLFKSLVLQNGFALLCREYERSVFLLTYNYGSLHL